ncbi:hypothetical protein C3L50_06960 [Flavobacterium alvei]|uniref:Uncharacterized protein n=1 Tax=Flavobacterium alvei TaxID=2080416 RepID=A0A2S5ADU3_9FLAO|nr:CFI-box-CTERM domain-containing protein [Flavobacterium alvei]POY40377.1 hypothetical protein C3L50_06960 [Flavobacterium alvei]
MSNYPRFESQVELLLFFNYEDALAFFESNDLKLSPAGKFHLWLLSTAYYTEILYTKKIINSFYETTILIEHFEKYTKNFYLHCRKNHKDEIIDICKNRKSNILDNVKINEYYTKSNEFFLNTDYNFNKLLLISYNSYISELSKFEDYFDYKLKNISISAELEKTEKPEFTFLSLFIYPFYYAMINNDKNILKEILNETFKHIEIWFKYDEFINVPYQLNQFLLNKFEEQDIGKRLVVQQEIIKILNANNKINIKSNESCYIATMAYKDINHPKVQNFRDFRDNYLSKTVLGNHFIKYYYKHSPKWVKVLEHHKTINKLIRFGLDILNCFIPKSKL